MSRTVRDEQATAASPFLPPPPPRLLGDAARRVERHHATQHTERFPEMRRTAGAEPAARWGGV